MNVFILGAVGAVPEYLLGIQETTVYLESLDCHP